MSKPRKIPSKPYKCMVCHAFELARVGRMLDAFEGMFQVGVICDAAASQEPPIVNPSDVLCENHAMFIAQATMKAMATMNRIGGEKSPS